MGYSRLQCCVFQVQDIEYYSYSEPSTAVRGATSAK